MEIKRMCKLFWEKSNNFNETVIERLVFYQKEGYTVLIASASPKLLIENACLKLDVKHVIGTELIPYKRRHIVIKNCRGPEKLIQIKLAFPQHHLAFAYSDNKDDMELLHEADQGYWVLGDGNIKPC
jgi:phosphoserine phosphatase